MSVSRLNGCTYSFNMTLNLLFLLNILDDFLKFFNGIPALQVPHNWWLIVGRESQTFKFIRHFHLNPRCDDSVNIWG